jgi:GAF domain-containing protein
MDDPLLATYRRSQTARLYERAAAIHESSAHRLRASGDEAGAVRVERFAAMARDRVEHPAAIAHMHALAHRLRAPVRLDELLVTALDGAMDLIGADCGTVQLVDPQTSELRIACQRGFGEDVVRHVAVVDALDAALGRPSTRRDQAVIADVAVDRSFAPHRAAAAAAGVRAVQATPLIDRAGDLRGVLSTHFHRPHRPAPHELRLVAAYAGLVADAIADRLGAA